MCVCICIYIYIHAYIIRYIHTRIHTYIHNAYTHTSIRTHRHTYMCTQSVYSYDLHVAMACFQSLGDVSASHYECTERRYCLPLMFK